MFGGLNWESLRHSGNDISLDISPISPFNPILVTLQLSSRYAPRYEPTLDREISATILKGPTIME